MLKLTVKHFIDGDTAVLSHSSRASHFVEGSDSSLNEVVRIGRAFALGEDVGDTHTLENGTHSTTGFHTGTGRSGTR